MSSSGGFGSDADAAALAQLVAEADRTVDVIRAAQIREVRVLAAAGKLAQKQAASASERVKAREMALRGIAAELAGVFVLTDRTVQRRIDEACDLVDNYPVTLAAWEAGVITRGHVRVIQETGCMVPADDREEFEKHAIQYCEGDTPNRVRDRLRMLAERLHPRTFTERHQDAAAGRCVRVLPGADGMSDLVATVPTVIAEGIVDRLTRQAKEVIRARTDADSGAGESGDTGGSSFVDDARSIDQVRADVFADLLLAGAPSLDPTGTGDGDGTLGAIRAKVQVVVSALTLSGADEDPADLVGRSPIDADTARLLAGENPVWDRLLTHPVTGTVLECDAYEPTAAMKRLLRARDRHCRFPGCRQPAIRCERDHTIAHSDGGLTHVCNLAHLCKRHHDVKHHTRWHVQQLPGGRLIWTSPTGRVYREDAPPPLVAFTVDTGPGADTGPPPPASRTPHGAGTLAYALAPF